MKVKIYGAGSIGNHMAQASRRMGWDVVVADRDVSALERMKKDIYPSRYGSWDNAIELFEVGKEPKGNFDIICIGTPPDMRMHLAKEALAEKPKILQLEKPLCTPTLEGLDEFLDEYKKLDNTFCLVGYDHAVAESIEAVVNLLHGDIIGAAETVDVEFREHWQGIFKAHPWLSGPEDTYLGYWKRGGGVSGEHSHALHLWQYLAMEAGLGRWKKASVFMDMKRINDTEYDVLSAFSIETDKGKIGRVVQDVITLPVRKWARIQGNKGFIEWFCNGVPEGDLVRFEKQGEEVSEKIFKKSRPDDFYREMLHINEIVIGKKDPKTSPLSFESGVSVMKFFSQAHKHRNSVIDIL